MIDLTFHLMDILNHIGFTIIHSFWQVTIIVILALSILKLFHFESARTRYNIAYSSLIFSATVVIATFIWSINQENDELIVIDEYASSTFIEDTTISSLSLYDQIGDLDIYQYSSYLSIFWLIGIFLLSIKYLSSWYAVNRLKKKGISAIPDHWENQFQQLLSRIQISKKVLIKYSAKISTPLVIGHLKPIVLVPLSFFNDLAPQEIEAIILHELAHIRRNDYILNIIQLLVELLIFFHPGIWYLSKVINTEREHACDDYVLATTQDPRSFAKALGLLQLNLSNTQNKITMNLFNDKKPLLTRLKRIMGEHPDRNTINRLFVLPILMLMVTLILSFAPKNDDNLLEGPDVEINASILEEPIELLDTVKIKSKKKLKKEKDKVKPQKKLKKKNKKALHDNQIKSELIDLQLQNSERKIERWALLKEVESMQESAQLLQRQIVELESLQSNQALLTEYLTDTTDQPGRIKRVEEFNEKKESNEQNEIVERNLENLNLLYYYYANKYNEELEDRERTKNYRVRRIHRSKRSSSKFKRKRLKSTFKKRKKRFKSRASRRIRNLKEKSYENRVQS